MNIIKMIGNTKNRIIVKSLFENKKRAELASLPSSRSFMFNLNRACRLKLLTKMISNRSTCGIHVGADVKKEV